MIGVAYIVSAGVFADFPDEEKRLWHSHIHAVKSGGLIIPELSEEEELEVMTALVTTYGKTIFTWNPKKHSVPIGVPEL